MIFGFYNFIHHIYIDKLYSTTYMHCAQLNKKKKSVTARRVKKNISNTNKQQNQRSAYTQLKTRFKNITLRRR